jgi:hypothetical protein
MPSPVDQSISAVPDLSPNASICQPNLIMNPSCMHTPTLSHPRNQYSTCLAAHHSSSSSYAFVSFPVRLVVPHESSAYTWYAIIIIQSRNTHPTNSNAHAAVQLWPAILLASVHPQLVHQQRVLTNAMLLQIRQGSLVRPRARRSRHVEIAVPVHAPRRTPQFNGDDNEAHHPQHEQYKRAHHHYAWEQLPLRY